MVVVVVVVVLGVTWNHFSQRRSHDEVSSAFLELELTVVTLAVSMQEQNVERAAPASERITDHCDALAS